MKNNITGEEYSKMPVYMQCMYEFIDIDNYQLSEVSYKNFISNMYYNANEMTFSDFKIWFLKNSPVLVIDNLQVL